MQVVTKICNDVRTKGVSAVLDYSARIDRAELTEATLRVPAAELEGAHKSADPAFLNSVRRIRRNVLHFQSAIVQQSVEVTSLDGSYLLSGICRSAGRHLRAGRGGGVSFDRADDGRAGPGGRRQANWPSSRRRPSSVRTTPTCWPRATSWASPRSIAWAARKRWRRLAYGVEGVPRVDKIVGPGNLFVALGQEARLWRRRYRLDRRAQRGGGDRRRAPRGPISPPPI